MIWLTCIFLLQETHKDMRADLLATIPTQVFPWGIQRECVYLKGQTWEVCLGQWQYAQWVRPSQVWKHAHTKQINNRPHLGQQAMICLQSCWVTQDVLKSLQWWGKKTKFKYRVHVREPDLQWWGKKTKNKIPSLQSYIVSRVKNIA